MPTSHQGDDDARGLCFAIVVSRYNDFITKPLLDGCVSTLTTKGATNSEIDVVGPEVLQQPPPWR